MKVADVTYEGRMRSNSYRAHSGRRYQFRRGNSVPMESVEDAQYFDNKSSTKVEWTAQGKLIRELQDDISDASEALKAIGYRQKQSLAKSFGIKANQDEATLEEELKPVVEEMKEDMENL